MNLSNPNQTLDNQLLTGGAWAFAGKAILAVSGLLLNALLTRLLTPQEVGAYFLTLTLVSVSSVVALLGLDHAIVRLIAESLGINQQWRAKTAIIKVSILVGLGNLAVISILASGLGNWFAVDFFDSNLLYAIIPLILAWIAVLTFQSLSAEIFRGFHDIRFASIFGGVVARVLAVFAFAYIFFFKGQSNLEQIVIITIATTFFSVLLAIFFITRTTSQLWSDNEGQLPFRNVLLISSPMLLTNLTNFVLNQADIWILGAIQTQEIVAIYGAAVRPTLVITMPLIIVNAVVLPVIAEMYTQNKKQELENVLQSSAAVAMVPTAIIVFTYVLFGETILGFLFGEFYRDGYEILVLLSVGHFINGLAGSSGYVLMMTGRQKLMMYIAIVSGFFTIALGLILIRPYGGIGVAGAMSIGLAMRAFAMWLSVKLAIGIWTHVSVRKLSYLKSLRATL